MTQDNRDSIDVSPAAKRLSGTRVAFFGGSFDPPHLGHLAVARAARAAFHLDTVLFAPVGTQPLKPEGLSASFEDRLAMTQLAIKGEPHFEVSLADAPKADGRPNFTLETLQELRTQMGPGGELFCLMGADSFLGLRQWHRAGEIPFVASLIVASRPGDSLDRLQAALPEGLALQSASNEGKSESGIAVRRFRLLNGDGESANFYVLPDLDVEISASQIRRLIRNGPQAPRQKPAAEPWLLPNAVADYIGAHDLYR